MDKVSEKLLKIIKSKELNRALRALMEVPLESMGLDNGTLDTATICGMRLGGPSYKDWVEKGICWVACRCKNKDCKDSETIHDRYSAKEGENLEPPCPACGQPMEYLHNAHAPICMEDII